jgi:hypothetical protein
VVRRPIGHGTGTASSLLAYLQVRVVVEVRVVVVPPTGYSDPDQRCRRHDNPAQPAAIRPYVGSTRLLDPAAADAPPGTQRSELQAEHLMGVERAPERSVERTCEHKIVTEPAVHRGRHG